MRGISPGRITGQNDARRVPVRLGTLALLTAFGIQACPHPAQAGWWGSSVASMDVRGITLGMTEDAVAKLQPGLQLQAIDAGGYAGEQYVQFDPSLVEHRLKDDGSDSNETFFVDFASAKQGGGVDNLYLQQTLPSSTNIADLLADMEKKYGSPTDLQQNNDVPDSSSTITASWGMSIADSSPESNPQSGQVLVIELENDDGDASVSITLTDFTVEVADQQGKKEFLAQVASQQTAQANKALNY